MIRLRGVRVDPGDHLMYVRLLKIPGNYCLVLLCQIVPVLFDMAYSALKTPDSNLDCSRLSLEQGDYHLSDKVVLCDRTVRFAADAEPPQEDRQTAGHPHDRLLAVARRRDQLAVLPCRRLVARDPPPGRLDQHRPQSGVARL